VAWKPLGDEIAQHPFDGKIHIGHEIDRALFVDAQRAAEPGHLQITRPDNRFDCRRQPERVEGRQFEDSENWRIRELKN
jgi:hypothetical protein